MSKTAIHKVRQHLQVVISTAELDLTNQPAVRDKILKHAKAIDRLLSHIEELASTCPAKEDCPNLKSDS